MRWVIVEVGDRAVAQRTRRDDVAGRATDHLPRFEAHRQHIAGPLVERDNRRLVEHDAAPPLVHQRVCGAEIDRQVTRQGDAPGCGDADEGGEQGAWVRRRQGRDRPDGPPRDEPKPINRLDSGVRSTASLGLIFVDAGGLVPVSLRGRLPRRRISRRRPSSAWRIRLGRPSRNTSRSASRPIDHS